MREHCSLENLNWRMEEIFQGQQYCRRNVDDNSGTD
jgi:hypothetical protein